MITDRFGPFVELDIPDEYKRSVHCVSRAKAVAVDIARPNVHLFHATIRTSRYNQDLALQRLSRWSAKAQSIETQRKTGGGYRRGKALPVAAGIEETACEFRSASPRRYDLLSGHRPQPLKEKIQRKNKKMKCKKKLPEDPAIFRRRPAQVLFFPP